jgi:hypothetical protein
MNYFKQIPEELLYIITIYIKDYRQIDMISKEFKLYIDYEEICKLYIPTVYSIIKKELYKYTDPPNYYLIYMAFVELSTYFETDEQTYLHNMFNYSNIHGLNYYILYKMYEYNDSNVFKYVNKMPKHRDKYLYVLTFINDMVKNINDTFISLFTIYVSILLENFVIDINMRRHDLIFSCNKFLYSIDTHSKGVEYKRLIIHDLIKLFDV